MAGRRWLVEFNRQHNCIRIDCADTALAQIAIVLTDPNGVAHRSPKHRTNVIRPPIHKPNMLFIPPIRTVQDNNVHGWCTFDGSDPALVEDANPGSG